LANRRGPDQFALLDAFVRRAAKPKTLSIMLHYLDAADLDPFTRRWRLPTKYDKV
jgi:hypothetical protein